jgi:hypothetical protein
MNRFFSSTIFALAALTSLTQMSANAQTCSKVSPAHTIALLELYTSEGCSSCPPADKFVSNLQRSTSLTTDQVIPISLHVDYWDYIGWKDVFAKPIFTQRQRALTELAGSRTVYTPEVFLAGREFRSWYSGNGVTEAVRRVNALPAQASIQLSLDKAINNKLSINLQGKTAQNARLHFALVEQNIVSQVNAGENRGVTLQHDYVVREWGDAISLSPTAKGESLVRQLPIPANANRKNLSVTAFIQSERGEILQALNLPVCASVL